jgi:hypothetical protein
MTNALAYFTAVLINTINFFCYMHHSKGRILAGKCIAVMKVAEDDKHISLLHLSIL